MFDLLIKAILSRAQERRNRRVLRNLLLKDDALLKDIGLSRTDVEVALSNPGKVGAMEEAYRLSGLTLRMDALR